VIQFAATLGEVGAYYSYHLPDCRCKYDVDIRIAAIKKLERVS
jgi:hypothetical protein